MHEASLILGMVPVIERHMKENDGNCVTRVITRIGKMSGVEVHTFEFAFDAIKRDYPWLRDAELTINEEPILYRCDNCGEEFEVDNFEFPACPKCDSSALTLVSGEELFLESLEIDKGDD